MSSKNHGKPILFCFSIGIMFVSMLMFPLHSACADSTTLPPELYSLIQKKLFFDAALSGTDPATLTYEQLQMLYGTGEIAGDIPAVGSIIITKKGFIAISGQEGQSRGAVLKGIYNCSMDAIEGTSIRLPPQPITITDEEYPISLAFTPKTGNGTIIVPQKEQISFPTRFITFFQNIPQILQQAFQSLKNVGQPKQTTVARPSQSFSDISTALESTGVQQDPRISIVTMTLFQDVNENNIYDSYELLVPWANVRLFCEML